MKTAITKSEGKWLSNYKELKSYIEKYRQLPDKKKEDNRRLLNWWKYNRKLMKCGKISSERAKLLTELSEMRKFFIQTDLLL